MVDSNATHNFISKQEARRLELKLRNNYQIFNKNFPSSMTGIELIREFLLLAMKYFCLISQVRDSTTEPLNMN